ncbi:hypothetical protein [Parasitella parasitica]|uniref:Uncharacterized protein n=1 Tax=Parasitella parasitica TaxID=35722 RepID=A0A0B7NY09_9FUNG|nr:hypothetical protein [Parasitella parasitica]
MLRVSSILYLQQVWSRPSSIIVADSVEPVAPINQASGEEQEQAQELPEELVSSHTQETVREQEQAQQEREEEHVSSTASRTVSFQEPSICSSLNIPSPSVATDQSETPVSLQPPKVIEREFYDDDIDLDDEEDEEEISTPPSTPSSKFSPKRILHRAKSSINDESVRNLGRRTSMFLDKFNYQSAAPATPSLRRQSSRLTNKGKTLSKKLKRVLSFHQTK